MVSGPDSVFGIWTRLGINERVNNLIKIVRYLDPTRYSVFFEKNIRLKAWISLVILNGIPLTYPQLDHAQIILISIDFYLKDVGRQCTEDTFKNRTLR